MSAAVDPPDDLFLYPMEVRDSECDMEGIVNNSVYMNYLEHARHRFFMTLGVSFAELTEAGVLPIVVRAEIDYKRPLRSADRFVVSVRMERVSALRFAFVQEIRVLEKIDEQLSAPPARVASDAFASLQVAAAARIIATAMNESGRPLPLEKWGPHADSLVAAIGKPAG